jgi:hypothetical protein
MFIMLHAKKHLIPFVKGTLKSKLISLLFHLILQHKQVVLEDMDNGFPGVKHFYLLHEN